MRGPALALLANSKAWHVHYRNSVRGPIIKGLLANLILANEASRSKQGPQCLLRVSMQGNGTRGSAGDFAWMVEHLAYAELAQVVRKGNYGQRYTLLAPAEGMPLLGRECLVAPQESDCVVGDDAFDNNDKLLHRHQMWQINKAIAGYDLHCPGDSKDLRGRLHSGERYAWILERGDYSRMQTAMDLQLVRHFRQPAEGRDYTDGGRLYGGWWIDYKKKARAHVLLEGEPIVESDYRFLAVALAYAQEGLVLDSDPYELGGYGMRNCWKSLIGAMLTTRKPLKGWTEGALPLAAAYPFATATELVMQRHAAIAKYFYSAWGMRSQRIESDLTVAAMLKCIQFGIPALPVHDAIWSRASDKKAVMATMLHVAREAGYLLQVQ